MSITSLSMIWNPGALCGLLLILSGVYTLWSVLSIILASSLVAVYFGPWVSITAAVWVVKSYVEKKATSLSAGVAGHQWMLGLWYLNLTMVVVGCQVECFRKVSLSFRGVSCRLSESPTGQYRGLALPFFVSLDAVSGRASVAIRKCYDAALCSGVAFAASERCRRHSR